MAMKRARRQRGRPKTKPTSILQDPRRYPVVLLCATLKTMKQPSIRAASKVIAATIWGNEINLDDLPPDGKDIVAKCPPGAVVTAYGPRRQIGTHGYVNTRDGIKAGTIDGAAASLRQLYRQTQREALVNKSVRRWITFSTWGVILASQGAPASRVEAAFRNSGDRELEAIGPGFVRVANLPHIATHDVLEKM
jgi:hypothetical protein